MRKCDICKKSTNNGSMAKVNGEEVTICSHCLVYSDNIKVKLARNLAKNGKRSKVNGELSEKCDYAPFWDFKG